MRTSSDFVTLAAGLVCIVEALLLLFDQTASFELQTSQVWGFALVAVGVAVIVTALERAVGAGRQSSGPAPLDRER